MEDAKRLVAAFFKSIPAGLELLGTEPRLMEARDGLGETPLHYLAVENQLEAVRALVERGAQVNTLNKCCGTPLSEAASLGYVELVKYLLSVGAKLSIEGQNESALHEAVRSGKVEMVQLVIEAGANINIADSLGETPLHAAAGEDKNIEIVRLLVRKGANINQKCAFEETPLAKARDRGASAIAEELLRAGAHEAL